MRANSASPGGWRRSRPVTRAAKSGPIGWICSMGDPPDLFVGPLPSGGLLEGRPRVLQRHAPHVARMLTVLEGTGAVQGAAVIPYDQVVPAPAMPIDELALGGVLSQVADQGHRLRH